MTVYIWYTLLCCLSLQGAQRNHKRQAPPTYTHNQQSAKPQSPSIFDAIATLFCYGPRKTPPPQERRSCLEMCRRGDQENKRSQANERDLQRLKEISGLRREIEALRQDFTKHCGLVRELQQQIALMQGNRDLFAHCSSNNSSCSSSSIYSDLTCSGIQFYTPYSPSVITVSSTCSSSSSSSSCSSSSFPTGSKFRSNSSSITSSFSDYSTSSDEEPRAPVDEESFLQLSEVTLEHGDSSSFHSLTNAPVTSVPNNSLVTPHTAPDQELSPRPLDEEDWVEEES